MITCNLSLVAVSLGAAPNKNRSPARSSVRYCAVRVRCCTLLSNAGGAHEGWRRRRDGAQGKREARLEKNAGAGRWEGLRSPNYELEAHLVRGEGPPHESSIPTTLAPQE